MGYEPREDHQDGRGGKEVVKERSPGYQESHGLPRYVNNIYLCVGHGVEIFCFCRNP